MLNQFRRLIASLVLAAMSVMMGTTALAESVRPAVAPPVTKKASPLPPLTVPPEPKTPGTAPDFAWPERDVCPSDQMCASGTKTFVIKKALRVLIRALRNHIDDVIRRLEPFVSKGFLKTLRNKAPRIAGFLETLLAWEELAYQTIYDQTYIFLSQTLNLSHLTSHWIALGIRWIIEWGLL